jgi:hypothetical protein
MGRMTATGAFMLVPPIWLCSDAAVIAGVIGVVGEDFAFHQAIRTGRG